MIKSNSIKRGLTIFLVLLLLINAVPFLPTQAASASASGQKTVIDFRGCDLRDVLSALALKMDVSIILTKTEAVEVNFKAENVTPRQALEMIIQSKGMAYIEHGGVIIVGPPATLQKDFFSQMFITRFDTRYIEASKLKTMIGEIGIPADNLRSTSLDSNPNILWAQGTAEGMRKVRELINLVDIAPQNKEVEQARFVYQLNYVVANDAAERLQKFDFGDDVQTITTSDDRFGRELIVICPKPIETQVKSALMIIDMPRKKISAPLHKEEGEYAHQKLVAMRDTLSQMSGVPVANLSISRNLGDSANPKYVLWAEESPDKIQMLKDLLEGMK